MKLPHSSALIQAPHGIYAASEAPYHDRRTGGLPLECRLRPMFNCQVNSLIRCSSCDFVLVGLDWSSGIEVAGRRWGLLPLAGSSCVT